MIETGVISWVSLGLDPPHLRLPRTSPPPGTPPRRCPGRDAGRPPGSPCLPETTPYGGLRRSRCDAVGRYEKGPGGNGIARRAMILAQLALGPLPEAAPVGIDNEGISIRDAGPERAPEGAAEQPVQVGMEESARRQPVAGCDRRSRAPRPAAAPLPAWSARQAGTGLRWPPGEGPEHPSASGPRPRWSRTGKCHCSGGRNRSPHRRAIHSRANTGWRNRNRGSCEASRGGAGELAPLPRFPAPAADPWIDPGSARNAG